jgi:hypothetical protein
MSTGYGLLYSQDSAESVNRVKDFIPFSETVDIDERQLRTDPRFISTNDLHQARSFSQAWAQAVENELLAFDGHQLRIAILLHVLRIPACVLVNHMTDYYVTWVTGTIKACSRVDTLTKYVPVTVEVR